MKWSRSTPIFRCKPPLFRTSWFTCGQRLNPAPILLPSFGIHLTLKVIWLILTFGLNLKNKKIIKKPFKVEVLKYHVMHKIDPYLYLWPRFQKTYSIFLVPMSMRVFVSLCAHQSVKWVNRGRCSHTQYEVLPPSLYLLQNWRLIEWNYLCNIWFFNIQIVTHEVTVASSVFTK